MRYCNLRIRMLVAGAMVTLAVTACHETNNGTHSVNNDEANGTEERQPDEIIISCDEARSMGVVTETVTPKHFCASIPVGGKITQAACDGTTVAAGMSGIVKFARPLTNGSAVTQSEYLLTITADHIQGGSPVKGAEIALENARKNYERAIKMVKDRIISEKEFNSIKAEYDAARIAHDATPNNGSGGISVKSPIKGYVKTCNVKEGDFVTIGQTLMYIVRNNRMYLCADVPERYYKQLAKVNSAKFRTSYSKEVHDISKLGGRLVSTGKAGTDTPGYITVTFEFNNTDGFLPGAFTEIWLLTDKKENAITLPISAITEEQGLFFVYLKEDSICYKKQEVTLGMTDGERVEITDGLTEGLQVVTHGAGNVKLAAIGKSIPAHTHNH